jgi:hypothetical protein
MMTHSPRTSPRAEYLQQENLRVQASPSIAEKFPSLKAVTVDLGYYNAENLARSSQIKYTVNVAHAKSVFRVACHNQECVRGDFDLSEVLARAVLAGDTSVSGEICCQGWRSRATVDTVPCGNILRYKLTLDY